MKVKPVVLNASKGEFTVSEKKDVDLSSDELMCLAIMDLQVAFIAFLESGEPEYAYSMAKRSMQELTPLASAVVKKLGVPDNVVRPPANEAHKIVDNILKYRKPDDNGKE
jgi:hypothetical protein